MSEGIMSAKDTIFGSAAQCYVTIDGTRYNFAQAIKLEAKATKQKSKVPILGSNSKGNKATSIEYTGNMTLHYNTSVMREIMEKYANQGIDTYFDIQVTTEDKSTSVGRQTTTLKGCNIDSIIIAKFDASSDSYMDEEFDFTFESWTLDEKFTQLAVMTAA